MVAALSWLVALALGLHELRRRRREPQQDPLLHARARRFALAALLLFVLALIARWWVVPSLGNWYGPFLPAEGFAARGVELRFGAAPALLQELVTWVNRRREEVGRDQAHLETLKSRVDECEKRLYKDRE